MDSTSGIKYYKRDFWATENLKFAEPLISMRKVAGHVRKLAGARELDAPDVGCGPGALAGPPPANLRYHTIDIAIPAPAANLIEADFVGQPIASLDMQFDTVVAQGVFEYMDDVQSERLAEIAGVVRDGGPFICAYQNFSDRKRHIYAPYSNVQRRNRSHPQCTALRAPQERISVDIPVAGRKVAIDYFHRCSPLPA